MRKQSQYFQNQLKRGQSFCVRFGRCAVILLLTLFSLAGCIPNGYTETERSLFLKQARAVLEDYLKENCIGAKITQIEPETEIKNDERQLTEFASGQFVWKDQSYDFLVNTKTGDVYTSVYLESLEEKLLEKILQEYGLTASEAMVAACGFTCTQKNEIAVTGIFENVFPVSETEEEVYRKILQDPDEYHFRIWIQYKGEDIPWEITEREASLPTLSNVTFYHIGDEHSLYQERYPFLVLPSLSEEYLQLSYSQSTPDYRYVRYDELEQDGFYVTYNACEKKREQGVVTETEIGEQDILLTVTEESVSLDCAKEGYAMYLSAEKKEPAQKYCYAFHWISGGMKKGMWYAYEGRYVYADQEYTETPHEFTKSHEKENVIYTSSGAK